MAARSAWAVGLWAVLWAAPVQAESRPTMLADYMGTRSHALEAELGWYTEERALGTTVHALAPVFSLRLAVARSFDLEVDWPLAFVTTTTETGDGSDELRSGNPFFAGYYVDRLRNAYLRVGFGFAAPVARVNELPDAVPPYYAAVMRGLWDMWLYSAEDLSLVVPFQLESRSGGLLLGIDSAVALMIPTDGDTDTDADLGVQLAGILGGKRDALSFGMRLQVVMVELADEEYAQLAFVPFLQGDFDVGFVYLRFVLNLDEPLGVFGDGEDRWGLMLGGGARF